MEKILIAMDTSENAMKAAAYAAAHIPSDAKVTLFHFFYKVLHGPQSKAGSMPHHDVSFDGSTTEFKKWLQSQRVSAEQALEQARRLMVDAGIAPENIEVRIEDSKEGVARDILNELESGAYSSIVVGRRGASGIKRFIAGSVSGKIVNHARKCAVWVVE